MYGNRKFGGEPGSLLLYIIQKFSILSPSFTSHHPNEGAENKKSCKESNYKGNPKCRVPQGRGSQSVVVCVAKYPGGESRQLARAGEASW